jgi:hypothetical protein
MASFETARTYQDVVDANVAFVVGDLQETPYHHGPLDEESEPLRDDLVAINAAGAVTVNSQPAAYDITWNAAVGWRFWRQRPYLEFYVHKKTLAVLLPLLTGHADVYCEIRQPDQSVVYSDIPYDRHGLCVVSQTTRPCCWFLRACGRSWRTVTAFSASAGHGDGFSMRSRALTVLKREAVRVLLVSKGSADCVKHLRGCLGV